MRSLIASGTCGRVEKQDFRILVADDDEIARDVLASVLKKEGYPVTMARDGLDAIRVISIDEVKLVITDLIMPGAGGLEVLKHAKKTSSDIQVIIVTAFGSLDTALDAINEGVFDYLTKPFRIQQLLFAARKAFDAMNLVNENRELRKQLRDTYRDIETAKLVSTGKNIDVIASWIERMNKLVAMNILNTDETLILKRRIIEGEGTR